MENMLPENSFPQICVVSVIEFVRIVEIRQEYEGSVAMCATSCFFPATAASGRPLGITLSR